MPCASTCGHIVPAATPFTQRLRDSNTAAGARPFAPRSLACELGLCADGGARGRGAQEWLEVPSFEGLAAGGSSGHKASWYARSIARHTDVRTLLLQVLAPGGRFSGDAGLIRALFQVEAAPVFQPAGAGLVQEVESAAIERARSSAKRWLQEPMLANSLAAWSAFAALEHHSGRPKQALRVRCAAGTPVPAACLRSLKQGTRASRHPSLCFRVVALVVVAVPPVTGLASFRCNPKVRVMCTYFAVVRLAI